ncbi:peptidylprolyl isomerase domain and WD repeat-containing protein 1 [Fistulifera solaris]|uniref:peptidylprolyl isomerase n=1 Tax=Fistulifera solaris TaxID=1519565 RepID=A0A1Z5JGT4_FISSO|nr:peptidylprolyl isomerase domain and WD repeat-containing protein 1 [Fistulifera solaris]|eukprot:GAX12988.1 peptidylprolyl isomerase domain and WD repeat-containing protein 1 [Fistulifera solaris]
MEQPNKRKNDDNVLEPSGKRRRRLENIPTSHHYHVSWMHANVVTHIVCSVKHGYIITASHDGVVKFWKRLPVDHRCLEFVKSFTAHAGPIRALCIDAAGDQVASVGSDKMIKFYDVSSFDVSWYFPTGLDLGTSACWIDRDRVACASASDGVIYIITTTEQEVQKVKLHGDNLVTCLLYNPRFQTVMSTDQKGIIEFWDASHSKLGDPLSIHRHGISYESKFSDTDLYTLMKKKTFVIAGASQGTVYALFCADSKIRLFDHETGKILVTFDERSKVYDAQYSQYDLDAMDYGRRAATEREIQQESTVYNAGFNNEASSLPLRISLQFDSTGQYLLVPTMMGIKCMDWQRRKLVAVIGKIDASQLRFLSICLAPGNANFDRQLLLARGEGSNQAISEEKEAGEKLGDALLLTTAYNQRRVYVFSHVDPVSDNSTDQDETIQQRDVWNEMPVGDDALYHHGGGKSKQQDASQSVSRAVIRTTLGDIHIELFSKQVPKTIENFVGHARSGYYDNVIFHRVIKGFMLQTGDPLGDGTGGESIWGGEFEDEFVPGLRHDRPFTVSMANAGPNTNGSQFFITTVPCPWLDNKHTVFGRVVKGMDVCTAIENVKTDDLDKPFEEISIQNIDLD